MVHQQPQPQQRPGGDADVASFLLQLKTNQNGEPVTEAEALRMAEQHHQAALNAAAARQQMPPQPQATAGLPYGHPGVIPGMYAYPGMVPFAPPPPQGNQFAAAAAAVAMGGMAPAPVGVPPVGYPAMHPVVAAAHQGVSQVAPIPGGVPGMNHSPQQQLAPGMQGGAPTDSGPVMTDAYIEHLITNDVVASNSKNSSNGSEGTENKETGSASGGSESPTNGSISAKDDMNIALVVPKDRDLIPDALFVALGQMKACRLQQSDRVGCYKTRTLGFMGMCCKHCGGQPGFGRYFPNSVRSLAQTTTSQTILKHIGGKCRFCPPNVRKAVLELQRQQAHKEHLTTGRPRYGSRKIFFQRMWARLHGPSEDGESAVVVQADVTPEKAKEEAEKAAAAAASAVASSSEGNRAFLVPPTTVVPLKREPSATLSTDGSASKRTLPTEVSNNNTDDEEGAPPAKGDSGVLSINLSLHGNSNKKRKVSVEDEKDTEAQEDEDENSKKLRISPVAV